MPGPVDEVLVEGGAVVFEVAELVAVGEDGDTPLEVEQATVVNETPTVIAATHRFFNAAPWLVGPATSLPPGSATEYAKPSREGRPVVHSRPRHAPVEALAPLTCDNTPDAQ